MAQSMYAGSLSSLIIIICLGWVDAGLNWEALLAGVFITASLATGARACQPWTFEHGKLRVEEGTWLTWSLTVVTLSLFLVGSLYLGASYWTRFSLAQEQPERKYDSNEAFVAKSMATSQWLPFNSALKLDLGLRYLDLGKLPEAYRMFSEAVSLRPLSSEALVAAVTAAAELGHESLSLKLMESESIGGFLGGRRLEHLVARILKQPQSDLTRKFLDLAFASDPSNSSRYLNLMILSGYSLETLRNHLPPRAETIMAYGDMLLAYGEKTSAEIAYIEAVYLNSKENRNVAVYMHVIDYFARDGQLSKAMVVALEGLDRLPNNPELDNMVAELSIQLGPDGRRSRPAGE
jgi:tetratricopeptide (TPR) repeat protein